MHCLSDSSSFLPLLHCRALADRQPFQAGDGWFSRRLGSAKGKVPTWLPCRKFHTQQTQGPNSGASKLNMKGRDNKNSSSEETISGRKQKHLCPRYYYMWRDKRWYRTHEKYLIHGEINKGLFREQKELLKI